MKTLIYICFIMFTISGCIATTRGFVYDKSKQGYYYKIKPGDKISDIARRYDVDLLNVIRANKILNPHQLAVGATLFLPKRDARYSAFNSQKTKVSPQVDKDLIKEVRKTVQHELLFPVANGKIVRTFSRNKKDPYDGIAIQASFGSKVLAADAGKVLFVGDDGTTFGLLTIIEHVNSMVTVYTHLDKAFIKEGQKVKKGEMIALVGKSGGIKNPLLHFQVRVDKKPQDPQKFIFSKEKLTAVY